jgi:hypothetical protein
MLMSTQFDQLYFGYCKCIPLPAHDLIYKFKKKYLFWFLSEFDMKLSQRLTIVNSCFIYSSNQFLKDERGYGSGMSTHW